ncbi:T-cell surface antigen CD2-like [Hemitrygon akajei]|uniref:T-cell surface antigen CD2-like n=1 Tax=Hemitrygon akajei TaxID=2704970 RepID=UPI003BFA2F07
MVSNVIFSQFSFFLLMAVSEWYLTESNDCEVNVDRELGDSVLLDILNLNSSTYNEVNWFKGKNKVARYKNAPKVYDTFCSKVNIFQNGSLSIISTSKSDEGKYTVEVFDKNGIRTLNQNFTLCLFEKLSIPVMKMDCVNEQDMYISCEVHKGTPVSFYLNEQPLTKHNTSFSNGGRKATLKNFTSSYNNKTFFCKVENPISEGQSTPSQPYCAGVASMATYLYIIFIALGVIALVIILRLLYCCISKTNNCNLKKLRI